MTTHIINLPEFLPHTPAPLRPSLRWMLLALGLVLCVSTFWKKGRLGDNSRSRFITVERLVERNTWAHVAPGDTTPFPLSIDAVKVGDRLYSSKPPLYPLLMAGEAKVLKAVTGWDFYEHRKDYNRFLVLLNQVFPYLLMLWVAMRFLGQFTQDRWTQHYMLLAMSVGLLAFGYAPEINNHTPGAVLMFVASYLVYRLWSGKEERGWAVAGTGLVMGLMITLELPALAMGLVMLGLIAYRRWWWALVAGGMMALPVIPSMLVYHTISGEWKPFYLQGKLYRYEGSYWSNPQASDKLLEPQWLYFLKTLASWPKGLLVASPVLLLPLAGVVQRLRGKLQPWLPMMGVLVLGIVAVIGYIGMRSHNYGGDCIGMRWYVVFMPLLMFMGWPMVQWLGQRSWGKVLAIALLALSMVQNGIALYMDCFLDITRL